MAVQLAETSISTQPKISTISTTRQRRIQSKRKDLTKIYIEAETQAKAHYIGLPYIDLYGFPVDTAHLVTIPESIAKKSQIGVFSIQGEKVNLATPFPGYDGQIEILDNLKQDGYKPVVHLCSNISFDSLLSRYQYVMEAKTVEDSIILDQARLDDISKNQESLRNLEEKIHHLDVTKAIETILIAAIQNKASDIHFEPEKDVYILRLRLDGVLHTFAKIPGEKIRDFESRLKLMSGLKLNVDNIPQDGRFSFNAGNREIDVRVSMLPSNYGYSIVMRLLGTGDVALNLETLGFTGEAQKRILKALNKPQGMILNTGPTGSGKTTTLYTFLSELNDGESKIITLEDPIEYKLLGVSQTQIDKQGGYTFASGLKSILRQDPDVVMVGEIRDAETASIAVQASLTGHQVLSTIHTNDAAGAIPRLMEMDIKGFLLADSLSAVIGQRLIRRVCPHCQTPYDPTDEEKQIIVNQFEKVPDSSKHLIPEKYNFVEAKGCEYCNGLGYKGRVGVYEVMTVTDGLRALLNNESPSLLDVRRVASKEGMVTMFQDAIIKAASGITTLSEVFKNMAGDY
jgi:type IV pilus assembly protein PilB